MNQKPHFRLETRGRIPWLESDCNLPNDVVEIPWKRELDPLTAHGGHVGSLATDRPAACLGRRSLGLIDFGISGLSYLCGGGRVSLPPGRRPSPTFFLHTDRR